VDTFEEEEEVDIVVVQKEIEELNNSLEESEKKMQKYMKEIGFNS
jgi:type I restriction enzyme M protein